MKLIDLHTHTLASDGTDSPSALVEKAHAAGLVAVAVTDHDTVAGLDEADLAPLRCGFRAKYILDAADKVASGEIDLPALREMELDEARKTLMTIKGVGPKVAECTLLYGFGRTECFPIDVWMKRAMAELFPDGLPECAVRDAGIAQQYIFHYMRTRDEKAG